ncbi:MAG: hypothetical protein HN700_19215 [Verrucomicrobia bacterium]|nr:hypothetical protein [Verrucomicrobiota bacterium]
MPVFLGTALPERLCCSPEALQYKMLVVRPVNAGWRLGELRAVFGHDPRMAKNRRLRAHSARQTGPGASENATNGALQTWV